MITFKTTGPSLSQEDLKRTEESLQLQLPQDFKQFLERTNGGIPDLNIFKFPDNSQDFGVSRFFGIYSEPFSDADLRRQKVLFVERVPKDFLPIADASGGNLVCISLRANDYGSIYFWDHELEAEEGEAATFSNLFKIGNSFQEFSDSLNPFYLNQVQLKPGQVKKAWINPDFLKSQKEKKSDGN